MQPPARKETHMTHSHLFLLAFIAVACDRWDDENNNTVRTPAASRTPAPRQPEPEATPAANLVKEFTRADVAAHATQTDCWIILDGRVYDLTGFFNWHPGGTAPVFFCGKDATETFNGIHPEYVKEVREKYFVGLVKE